MAERIGEIGEVQQGNIESVIDTTNQKNEPKFTREEAKMKYNSNIKDINVSPDYPKPFIQASQVAKEYFESKGIMDTKSEKRIAQTYLGNAMFKRHPYINQQ